MVRWLPGAWRPMALPAVGVCDHRDKLRRPGDTVRADREQRSEGRQPLELPTMSGEMVPKRRDLRASHEDRDQVVEQLRVAAGDGRLSSEELDERLEAALTARTYADLEELLVDLPVDHDAVVAPPPAPVVAEELVQMSAKGSNIDRIGPWAVPRRMELDVHGGNIVLDFTQAVLTGPALDLNVQVHGGNLRLIVPQGVAVDVGTVHMHGGSVRRRVHSEPGVRIALLVTVSGRMKGGKVIIQGPRTSRAGRRGGWWGRLFRRRSATGAGPKLMP